MAYVWKTAESGRRNYVGSPLQQRNDKLKRAARIAPVCIGDADCEEFAGSTRVMTASEYAANGDSVSRQVEAGREAHLLVHDAYNDGEFLPVEIYDVSIKQEDPCGLIEFDLHAGTVLVKADTLIYWK